MQSSSFLFHSPEQLSDPHLCGAYEENTKPMSRKPKAGSPKFVLRQTTKAFPVQDKKQQHDGERMSK